MCCAGSAAFDYIKSQVLNISEQISELSGNDNIENIAGWCSTILRGVSRLDALLTSGVKAKADESKGANGSTSTVAHSGLFKTSSGELKRNRALSGGEPFEQAEHAPSRSKSDIQITPTGCAMSDVTTNIKSVGNIQITDPVVLKRNRTLSGGEPFEQAEQASFRSKLDTQVAHADAAKSDVVPRAKLGLGINLFKLAPAEPKSNWTVSDGVELHTAHHPTSAEILISLV